MLRPTSISSVGPAVQGSAAQAKVLQNRLMLNNSLQSSHSLARLFLKQLVAMVTISEVIQLSQKMEMAKFKSFWKESESVEAGSRRGIQVVRPLRILRFRGSMWFSPRVEDCSKMYTLSTRLCRVLPDVEEPKMPRCDHLYSRH